MRICVVGGAGYVGLVTGVGFAELGNDVTMVDVDEERLRKLQRGESPIYEEGLEALLSRNLAAGRLRFSRDLAAGVAASDAIFVTVGTPSRDDGHADLSQILQVAESLARCLTGYTLVVIKSTVPVGTVELVRDILSREREEGKEYDIVSNPEFLQEGNGLSDFFYPSRIVIGSPSSRARALIRELYQPVVTGDVSWTSGDPRPRAPVPVVETDLASAQMIKYASNAFLATRVSFINEMAALCERVGADVSLVAQGMGYDPRIGHRYLQAGLGFGGPCLEKDLRALIKIAESNSVEPYLAKAVLERNERQVREVIAKLKRHAGYLLYGKIVAVLGLAFKPGTSDVRNSLSLRVIDLLEEEGARVRAYDPVACQEAHAARPRLMCCADAYEAARQAEAVLVLTEWPQFRELDFPKLKKLMAKPCIVDARNLLDPQAVRALGFAYTGVGRP